MNPVEWLLYAAACDVFLNRHKWLTRPALLACAEVVNEGTVRS